MVAPESYQGSTSRFYRVRQGVLLKYPLEVWRESSAYQKLTDEIANNLSVERQILDFLGEHPRIVRFIFPSLPHSINPSTHSKYERREHNTASTWGSSSPTSTL